MDMMRIPTTNNTERLRNMESAVLRCHCAVYEDWLRECPRPRADLAVAFNAGVWGYREWKPTIEYMVQQKQSIPFVFTAYTVQEAEDDFEVIQQVVSEASDHNSTASCFWEAEANPFSSRQDRDTANAATGRQYRENAAWQGWRL